MQAEPSVTPNHSTILPAPEETRAQEAGLGPGHLPCSPPKPGERSRRSGLGPRAAAWGRVSMGSEAARMWVTCSELLSLSELSFLICKMG